MRLRACAALLLLLSACATTEPSPRSPATRNPRVANLQRAATLPWADGGQCVVREASNAWAVLVERCFHALDHDRLEFRDVTGRCAVASAGAAALGLGICVLIAPEIIVGAVIVAGAVVVAAAINEELVAYRRASRESASPEVQTQPLKKPAANRKPEPSGQDGFPPGPPELRTRERRPDCKPVPVPHAGDDAAHNECADKFPPNRYPGMDVIVGGERFDALQVGASVLWEIKTHRFDTYSDFIRDRELERELEQIAKERNAAAICGYDFIIGVSTQAHKEALIALVPSLRIVVTGCTR
ncbi:DUF6310 domain-containing protein [Myxococcus sp. K38C18041901]|uniref:DUF6310 domain-containing protein n=1 Tax=Myxococcus guangdongensis TaxID=2906760 RepID=UPI0020A75AE7|nr:DUF6310 domain-containing protein [Myxococcus guangdongensis]MCP3059552.1 DUF6310 domain-containing protein [Myxococcus guangdongensis]